MMRPLRAIAGGLVACSLAGCHLFAHRHPTPPPQAQSVPENSETQSPSAETNAEAESPERDADLPPVGQESLQPCLPAGTKPKPAPKRKPKPAVQVAEAAPPGPPVPTPPPVVQEPEVRALPTTSVSVLGRKVQSPSGEDMGRVVDVLVDPTGHTRIAIIEFGGFLGVGNRRIAVEWSLLKFHPEQPDAPLTLNVPKAKIQSAPDYKDTFAHPPVLMAPPAPTAEGSK
jgi:hypothetical protein